MDESTHELFSGVEQGSLERVQSALAAGADVNFVDDFTDTPLTKALDEYLLRSESGYEILDALLAAGASPNYRDDEENVGVFFQLGLLCDARATRILLEAGFKPNFDHRPHQHYLNWAITDYCFSYFGTELPLKAHNEEISSVEDMLDHLERCAGHINVKGPDHLRVLRQHGAMAELNWWPIRAS